MQRSLIKRLFKIEKSIFFNDKNASGGRAVVRHRSASDVNTPTDLSTRNCSTSIIYNSIINPTNHSITTNLISNQSISTLIYM